MHQVLSVNRLFPLVLCSKIKEFCANEETHCTMLMQQEAFEAEADSAAAQDARSSRWTPPHGVAGWPLPACLFNLCKTGKAGVVTAQAITQRVEKVRGSGVNGQKEPKGCEKKLQLLVHLQKAEAPLFTKSARLTATCSSSLATVEATNCHLLRRLNSGHLAL